MMSVMRMKTKMKMMTCRSSVLLRLAAVRRAWALRKRGNIQEFSSPHRVVIHPNPHPSRLFLCKDGIHGTCIDRHTGRDPRALAPKAGPVCDDEGEGQGGGSTRHSCWSRRQS